jgi:L-iditol 2-dehydrogenase
MNEKRLEIAKQLGATCTVTIDTKEDAENTVKKVVAALGQMPDYTIDCAGFQSTITLGLLATKPGGAVIIAGMGQSSVTIPLIAATVREVDIKGIFRYKNTWPLCRQLLEEGKIDVKKLITHRFPLEKALDAFEVAKSGEGIKVIIDCVRTDV